MPGQIPNRSTDLSRERDANRGDRIPLRKGALRPVKEWHADPDWHNIAKKVWASLKTSGQNCWYQDSDWAFAYSICDDLSNFKKSSRPSAQMAAVIYSALGSLLMTEGDRRRARIELTDETDETAQEVDAAMETYSQGLRLVS